MMVFKLALSFAAILALANSASLFQEDPVIQTKNGAVRGRVGATLEQRKTYFSFRGIPFAEAPINNLRFEAPVAKSNWNGVLDATEDRDFCIQGSDPVTGNEDCLFLNIYTPSTATSCKLLPTMVWIYGGGFEGGNSQYDLYAPDHLLDQGLVVVTLNYRLGMLGFGSTGDLVLPGNNGLKDQLLAMKWVKNNIASFCGNPNEITLAGQSAGSASVAYHIQSPKSAGLFNRAILQSGTSLSLWAYSRRSPQMIKDVATTLGIDTTSSRTIIDALKKMDVYELQANASATITSSYLGQNPREGFAMGPTSEPDHPGAFFSGRSYELLESGNFNKVPILIGYNSLEGTYNFEFVFRLYLIQYDRNPEKLLPIDMNVPAAQQTAAAKELKSHYFGWLPISLSNMELMTFLSDDQFVRSIIQFGRLVQKHAPVYMYRFSYEGGLWGLHNRTTPGVTHSEELGYYWVSKHEPARPQDLVVKDRMIKLWSNFVKNANPTPTTDAALKNLKWNSLGDKLNYIDIGEELVAKQKPEQKNLQFWDDFYAKYGHRPYATY